MANKNKNKKKKKERETKKAIEGAANDSGERKPAAASQELREINEADRRWVDGKEGKFKVEMMFSKQLDSSDANPELNRAVIKVYSDEMKKALSLTQQLKETPYIRVLVRDPRQVEYQLRFSKIDQETYILYHEWGKLVAENGLKEGCAVIGHGNRKFAGNHFRVFLRIIQGQESCFLFEKKLTRTDLKKQLAIEWCSPKLKRALQGQGGDSSSYIRVLTQENANKKVYELRLSRRGITGYSFHHEWRNLVADNGLKEGDTVAAVGAPATGGFASKLYLSKNEETNQDPIPALFFDKELEFSDINVLLNSLEIESCNCKEAVKELVAKKLEEEKGYVRVCGLDASGRAYDKLRLARKESRYVLYHGWREVVSANGLMVGDRVTCWGHDIPANAIISIRIDIDKAMDQSIQ